MRPLIAAVHTLLLWRNYNKAGQSMSFTSSICNQSVGVEAELAFAAVGGRSSGRCPMMTRHNRYRCTLMTLLLMFLIEVRAVRICSAGCQSSINEWTQNSASDAAGYYEMYGLRSDPIRLSMQHWRYTVRPPKAVGDQTCGRRPTDNFIIPCP